MNIILVFLASISSLKWDLSFNIKKIQSSIFRKMVRNNKLLKNKHIGKRCFIVGNGPSLTKLDLRYLKNEITFTVNFLYKNKEIFNTICPNYHILIDPYFAYKPDEYIEDIVKNLKACNSNISCICTPNLFVKFKEISVDIECYGIFLHDNWQKAWKSRIDLSKNSYNADNVVHAAIYSALYMGFSEIILIGCELTGIYESFEFNANQRLINNHVYNQDAEIKSALAEDDNLKMLEEYARTFRLFKHIKTYATENKCTIWNATQGGILDIFPRKQYNSFF